MVVDPAPLPRRPGRRASHVLELSLGALAALALAAILAPGAAANHPGPDASRYVALDSGQGVAVNFLDIRATGTALPVGDDAESTINFPAGFTFDFYDRQDLTRATMNANGVLRMDAACPGDPCFTVTDLSTGAGPTHVIGAYWTDQNSGCATTTAQIDQEARPADAPYRGRIQVVQWTDMSLFGNDGAKCTTPLSTYQVQLFEGTDILELQLRSVTNRDNSGVAVAFCQSASVGIKGAGPGLSYVFANLCTNTHGGNPVIANRAVRFWRNDADAQDQAFTIGKDETLAFSLAASDDPKTFRIVTPLPAGTGTLSGLPQENRLYYLPFGGLTYVPPAGWTGTTAFTYEVNDGRDGPRQATVTITIPDTGLPLSVDIVEDNVAVAAGDGLALTGNVSHGEAPITCTWTIPGALLLGAATDCATVAMTFDDAGTYTATLRATDAEGTVDQDTATLTVSPPPPMDVDITGSLALAEVGQPLTLSSHALGGLRPYTCTWTAAGATLAAANCDGATVTYAASGMFEVRLTVRDKRGIEASDTLSVQAEADACGGPCPPPQSCGDCVTADYFVIDPAGRKVRFRDTSFSDAQIESWTWEFGDGATSTLPAPTHTYDQFGAYTVRLTVNTVDGRVATWVRTIEVLDPTVPPTTAPPEARAGPDLTATEGTAVVLDGTGGDGSRATRFWWRQVGGPGVPLAGPDQARASFTAPDAAPGHPVELVFLLVISDGAQDSAGDLVTVTVVHDDVPVSLPARADQTAPEGAVVQLDASGAKDPEGLGLTYAWMQVSGPPVTLSDPAAVRPTFTAPQLSSNAGATLEFRVTVRDAAGHVAQDVVAVAVRNLNEAPVAGFDLVAEGSQVAFSDLSTDAEGGLAYAWSFGDGATSRARAPQHAYGTPGSYIVSLTVTDDAGETSTLARTVEILAQAAGDPGGADAPDPDGGALPQETRAQADGGALPVWAWVGLGALGVAAAAAGGAFAARRRL